MTEPEILEMGDEPVEQVESSPLSTFERFLLSATIWPTVLFMGWFICAFFWDADEWFDSVAAVAVFMVCIAAGKQLLACVYTALEDAVILKSGSAMELRLERVRTTRDIDMHVEGDLNELVEDIPETMAKQGEDYLTLKFSNETYLKKILGAQAVYGMRGLLENVSR